MGFVLGRAVASKMEHLLHITINCAKKSNLPRETHLGDKTSIAFVMPNHITNFESFPGRPLEYWKMMGDEDIAICLLCQEATEEVAGCKCVGTMSLHLKCLALWCHSLNHRIHRTS